MIIRQDRQRFGQDVIENHHATHNAGECMLNNEGNDVSGNN